MQEASGAPTPATDLPPTSYAVLGVLSFGRDLSGYDVKKWADASLRFFYWSPAVSQIYAELKRLEGLGLATARTVEQDELRNKRVYTITDEGRARLRTWIEDAAVEPTVHKNSTLLRLWVGHMAQPERLREMLASYREQLAGLAADAWKAHAVSADEAAWSYPSLVDRFAARAYDFEIELVDELVAALARTSRDHRAEDQP